MFAIDSADPTPLYAQLDRAIRAAIAIGDLRPGDQLPTVRQLAVDLRINANTVAKVYGELERAGVLATQRGRGTFVRERSPEALGRADRERELRAIVDRFLADAAAIGVTIPEIIRHLERRRSQES
jgi:GntR family transcriptional regulator